MTTTPTTTSALNMQAAYNGFQSTFRNCALTSSIALSAAVFLRGVPTGRERNLFEGMIGAVFVISIFVGLMAAEEFSAQIERYRAIDPNHLRPEWSVWPNLVRTYCLVVLGFFVTWCML